jgi:hypothetical protein
VRQESLVLEAGGLFSAEGRLIEELKRDAEQRLRAKDAEITRVQTRLDAIDEERRSLQDTMEERVSLREAELRRGLEAELAAERERLQGLGTSESDIERRLRALEESKRREYDLALAQFRETSEAELAAKEAELTAATRQLQDTLAQSSREKNEISRQAKDREEDLRRRFEQETAALEAKSSQTEQQLAELAELRRREELFTDQILAAYARALADLEDGNLAAARRDLSGLAGLLSGPGTENLPAVARRKRVDLAIIAGLEELLDLKSAPPAVAPAAAPPGAALPVDLQPMVGEAAALAAAGRLQEAAALYTRALASVPPLKEASEGLAAAQKQLRVQALEQSLAEAGRLLRRDEEELALQSYRAAMAAAADAPLTGAVLEGVEQAVTRRESRKLSDSRSSIAGLQRDLTARRREIETLQAQLRAQSEEIARLESRPAAAPAGAGVQDAEQVTARARAAAFGDLRTYLRAQSDLSGHPELESALAREPEFRRVVADIEALLVRGAEEPALAAAIVRLLGTVSRVLPDQVVIEPLVKVTAEPGAPILIRRSVLGREISIARGVIERVTSDRITASIRQIFQADRPPAEQDTVYLTQ